MLGDTANLFLRQTTGGTVPPVTPETMQPDESGFLDVGDGHLMYWETVGDPDLPAVVYLHGGPGSGCSVGQRRLVDTRRYRLVLFDQRGSGRSLPSAAAADADLSTNTTRHLIADIESLRSHLGVDRWSVLGLSWGSTLGLAYAQHHPEQVVGIVLGSVTNTTRREVDWITVEMGRIFPEAWHRFARIIPQELSHLRPVDAYAELLFDADPAVRRAAAAEWCRWEDTHVSLAPEFQPHPGFSDPEFALTFARLVTHYWRHSAFLEEGQLVRDANVLNGIPGVMIHGRHDISGPVEVPWRLAQRWSTGRLRVLEDVGHGGGASFLDEIDRALEDVHSRRTDT